MKVKNHMIGAIAGDIIGSTRERNRIKTIDFELFPEGSRYTDDTILTVAIADSILNNVDFETNLRNYYKLYPAKGYGHGFKYWAMEDDLDDISKKELEARGFEIGMSQANGSAMRVSPVGYAYDTLDRVLRKAKQTSELSHGHPEGIKGAQATAACTFLAREGKTKEEIREYIETKFKYDLHRTVDEIRLTCKFKTSCAKSVPESILCFLESENFEHAIRLAISLGGDSDTMACISGELPRHIIMAFRKISRIKCFNISMIA